MRHGRSSSACGGAAACAPSFPAERVEDGRTAFQDRPARMRVRKVPSRASPVHVFLLTGLLIGGMLTLSGSRGSALQPPDEGWTGLGRPTPGGSPQRPATRLKVEAKGGIFLVYDAATPRDAPHPHPPYVAYWNDFESEYIYAYGRLLWTLPDVGHALLSLQRDLGIEATPMAEAGPILDTAITGALAEPEDPTPWHYASYRFIQELMGLDPGADVDSSPITLGEALAIPPGDCDDLDDLCCPCCPMAGITPTVRHIPGPPPWASAPWLIDRGIGIVASCGGGGSGWPRPNPGGGGGCSCVPGRICCDGTCRACVECCVPDGSCCRSSAFCCKNIRCCPVGDDCCDDGACCPAGGECCDNGGCCPYRRTCCGSTCCNLGEVCFGGVCCSEDCDDGNSCTSDQCWSGSCYHILISGGTCERDGNPCTKGHCEAGACIAEGPRPGMACADDGDLCTDDICAENGECAHPYNSDPCADDGNPCTDDVCSGGACTHPANDGPCEDNGNPCTDDRCSEGVCTPFPNSYPCDDGDPCTKNDACSGGTCAGTEIDCNDGNPCTDDACVYGICSHTPNDSPGCGDGPCPGGCDDGDQCTVDSCDDGTCTNTPHGGPCDDGDSCTENDACSGGTCTGTPMDCDDGDPCTHDWCWGDETLGLAGVGAPLKGKCMNDPLCEEGECCNPPCEACQENGTLSDGTTDVDPDPACIGDTITFTVTGVVDNGGIMRVDCTSKRAIDPVTPTYTWEITRPVPFVPVTGSGAGATVLAELPGEYSCTFTATANRECEPPPFDLGPETTSPVHLDLAIYNGGSDLDNGDHAGALGSVVSEDDEETLGAYILVNWDDDDGDGAMNADGSWSSDPVPDLFESSVQNEDNLGKLVLAMNPVPDEGTAELETTGYDSQVRAWSASTKQSEINLGGYPWTWDLGDPAERASFQQVLKDGLWIEGYAPSVQERDVVFVLRYKDADGQELCSDTVKATVVMINLANAVYREGQILGASGRGHSALVWKFIGPLSKDMLENDAKFLIIHMQGGGVVDNHNLTAMTQSPGEDPWGCFTNPGITYPDRLKILEAAKRLVATGVAYVAEDAVEGDDEEHPERWDGKLNTIGAMRCDGLIEVCYEINGVEVWGMAGRPPDGGVHYNITDPADYWSYNGFTGEWTQSSNQQLDNLEEHNDFDVSWFDWIDTLQPATQCGHEAPVDANTRFQQQNLCIPVGSEGGN